MIIHHSKNSPLYTVSFGIDPSTSYGEGIVANNALSLNPFWQEYYAISDEQALEMSLLGNNAMRSQQENTKLPIDLENLKLLGSALLSYEASTKNDLLAIPNVNRSQFSTRRIEGYLAGQLAVCISRRPITISPFKNPPKLYPIGFSR